MNQAFKTINTIKGLTFAGGNSHDCVMRDINKKRISFIYMIQYLMLSFATD